MSGLGPAELVIIILVVLALFGPTLIAFWLGFTLGRKSSTSTPTAEDATPPEEQSDE